MSRNTYDGRRNGKVLEESEDTVRPSGERMQSNSETDGGTVGAADIIDSIAAVATVIEEPLDDDEFIYHEDSKLLRKERRHKEELGMKM